MLYHVPWLTLSVEQQGHASSDSFYRDGPLINSFTQYSVQRIERRARVDTRCKDLAPCPSTACKVLTDLTVFIRRTVERRDGKRSTISVLYCRKVFLESEDEITRHNFGLHVIH